jgi:SecD/SecF fusion protein
MQWQWVVLLSTLAVYAAAVYGVNRYMKTFFWRFVICLTPLVAAGLIVANAFAAGQEEGGADQQKQRGGFKLGVDLVGGTTLVYAVDPEKSEGYNETQANELVLRIKRRLDPNDLKNITVRPVSNGRRVEIVVPRQVDIGQVKEQVTDVGSLEFRILANDTDDDDAIKAARDYIDSGKNNKELERRAALGQPPPPPVPPPDKQGKPLSDGTKTFHTEKGDFTYTWVELGMEERMDMGLDNQSKDSATWKYAAEHRGKTFAPLPRGMLGGSGTLLYSRKCINQKNLEECKEKQFEYFILVRDPKEGKRITGELLKNVSADHDQQLRPIVKFTFNATGGNLFHEVTSDNSPTKDFHRHLAIILDSLIISSPQVNEPIGEHGQISGHFTDKKVQQLVANLNSGRLPATLIRNPVSENTMGATLGSDTIRKGTWSVGFAFAAILIFMLCYYEFAGLVACVALLANLLLTVGFMVLVQAAFTLPGLAGLVLMLGMAVDANVLIYERLREERDRGASLALAIRNGYDRAFPTIIDTHLSSIFTAIVLYIVGNDQLKGFGVSLTVGLIISLFTSLYMTRLLFDIWLTRGWVRKLSMRRLFSRPNINFMGIRYYWFTATIFLTVVGITVFLIRGRQGLNIDFVGGTAYGGQLVKEMDLEQLRARLDEQSQKEQLAGVEVKEIGKDGRTYEVRYPGTDLPRTVTFAHKPLGDDNAESTPKQREEDVKKRAAQLPDMAVELIFPQKFQFAAGNASTYFTVRTSEKEPDLVQAVVGRLLGGDLYRVEMDNPKVGADGKTIRLAFHDPKGRQAAASTNQVQTLLQREFAKLNLTGTFQVIGVGTPKEGSQYEYENMVVSLNNPVGSQDKNRAKLDKALDRMQAEFRERPQPDRLENFDKVLAEETQKRAMWAILASWAAILLYLWFRFGSWTFGLAAVLCLMHDLFFTMGIIAFCHYIAVGAPWLAHALLIDDFKLDLPSVAALLTLVGYSVNDTIVVFDRIREVRGKNPELTPQTINDSVNQTLSRTLLTSFATWLVVIVLYIFGGEGVHLFAFCMVIGVIVGTYSSIYIASPLLLIFGEGARKQGPARQRQPQATGATT